VSGLIDRELTPDSLWQHLNGNKYRIIAVDVYTLNHDFTLFSYLRLDKFKCAKSLCEVELFDYEGVFAYGGTQDRGALVFYSGDSGRWYRPVEQFLSKKSDDYRFVRIHED
jgi:hypothetical protein